jgi:hypothetical protein
MIRSAAGRTAAFGPCSECGPGLCGTSRSEGQLVTGPNTEDTPVIVEAAAFHDAVVIVQVNKMVDRLPRVDTGG